MLRWRGCKGRTRRAPGGLGGSSGRRGTWNRDFRTEREYKPKEFRASHAASVSRIDAKEEGADGDAHAPAFGLAGVTRPHKAGHVLLRLSRLRAERGNCADAVEDLCAAVAGGSERVRGALIASGDGDFEEYHDDHNRCER